MKKGGKFKSISNRSLEEGARAHYRDPSFYDFTYRHRATDIALYAELATELGGPVLELGVGSGRVAMAIASQKIDVVGIDFMRPMLEQARARLQRRSKAVAKRVSLLEGDIRRIRLRRKFPLVISPFNVFMHFYSVQDVSAALATARAHLAMGGRFAFDVLMPDLGSLLRDPGEVYRGGFMSPPRRDQRYEYFERFDYDVLTQVQHVTLELHDPKRRKRPEVTHLAQRQFFPAELEALVHHGGFKIEHRWGNFRRGPLRPTSESQIIVARKR